MSKTKTCFLEREPIGDSGDVTEETDYMLMEDEAATEHNDNISRHEDEKNSSINEEEGENMATVDNEPGIVYTSNSVPGIVYNILENEIE